MENIKEGIKMLGTIEERVIHLKRGFTSKDIEKAYLIVNDMRIINRNILFYPKDQDTNKNINT